MYAGLFAYWYSHQVIHAIGVLPAVKGERGMLRKYNLQDSQSVNMFKSLKYTIQHIVRVVIE